MKHPDSSSTAESRGTPVYLQSANLYVDLLPDNGGRVASLRCRHSGTEFLLGGSNYFTKAEFSACIPFEQSDCAGIDECLPTVSASISESEEGNAPDHGDLWRHSWRVLKRSENDVVMASDCSSRPFSLTRRACLQGSELQFEYRIKNLGKTEAPFLYACHPLFAVEPEDRLILPGEVTRMRLHYSRGDRTGRAGEMIPWPLAVNGDEQIELDKAGEKSDETAEMLYTSRLTRGICALYRARRRQAIVMRFDAAMLPYLGLWLCNGGWPDDPTKRRQYAVAMEPTVAPRGSLAEAIAAKEAPIVKPGADFAFSHCLEVLGCDRPWSYEEVKEYVNQVARADNRA